MPHMAPLSTGLRTISPDAITPFRHGRDVFPPFSLCLKLQIGKLLRTCSPPSPTCNDRNSRAWVYYLGYLSLYSKNSLLVTDSSLLNHEQLSKTYSTLYCILMLVKFAVNSNSPTIVTMSEWTYMKWHCNTFRIRKVELAQSMYSSLCNQLPS